MRVNAKLSIFFMCLTLLFSVLYLTVKLGKAVTSSLIADYNEIGFSHACSYYKLSYSGTLINWMYDMVTLNISKVTEVVGNFSGDRSWTSWEWQVNISYNETIPNCTIISTNTANGTQTYNTTCNPYIVTKSRLDWVKNTPANLNLYGNQLYQRTASLGYTEVRYCADISRELTSKGWEIALDHIPRFAGVDYPSYQWWNNSWARRVNITITASNLQDHIVEYWINFTALSGISNSPVNCTNETRVVRSDGTEIASRVYNETYVNGISQAATIVHSANDTNPVFSVYYNNSGATYPSYTINWGYDTFNTTTALRTDVSPIRDRWYFFNGTSYGNYDTGRPGTSLINITSRSSPSTGDINFGNAARGPSLEMNASYTFRNFTVQVNQTKYSPWGVNYDTVGIVLLQDTLNYLLIELTGWKYGVEMERHVGGGRTEMTTIAEADKNVQLKFMNQSGTFTAMKKNTTNTDWLKIDSYAWPALNIRSVGLFVVDQSSASGHLVSGLFDWVCLDCNVTSYSISIGTAESPTGGDTTPPTYTNNGTNNTNPAPLSQVLHYAYWTDNVALSYYIFGWNATGALCNGGFTNDSAIAFGGNPSWSNITKQMPLACSGKIIDWIIYANDTSNNWNSTMDNFEYVSSFPTWSNNNSIIVSPYNGSKSEFNISWSANMISVVIELNDTGTPYNCTASNTYGGNIWNCTKTIGANSGMQQYWKSYGSNSSGANTTDTWYFTVNPPPWNIYQCVILTLNNTVYTVNTSFTNSSTGTLHSACIDLSNVYNSTLDCQGYTLTGSNADKGIYDVSGNIQTKNNVIKNCNLNGWDDGIYMFRFVNYTITNNSITNSGDAGIYLFSGSNSIILNNIVNSNNPYGINLDTDCFNNILTNNTIHNNPYGILIVGVGSNNNTISNGSIALSSNYDYYLAGGLNNSFTNTNFSSSRKIDITNANIQFNYRNSSSSSIWLYTNASTTAIFSRILLNMTQNNVTWNDSSTTSFVASYGISGLQALRQYNVYNNTALLYNLWTSGNGVLPPFTVPFTANSPQLISVNYTSNVTMNITLWNPIDNYNTSSTSLTFTYTPYFNGTNLINCSLWGNQSGVWQYIGNGGYNNGVVGDGNYAVWNLPDYGVYRWTIQCCNDTSCIYANENRTFTATAYPHYFNNASQLVSIFTPIGYSNFSITWSDNSSSVTAYLENDFAGSLQNTPMSGSYPNFYYNSSPLSAGTYHYRFIGINPSGLSNSTSQLTFTISQLAITQALAINGTEADQTFSYPSVSNVTAWFNSTYNNDGSITLTRNGVPVSNPDIQSGLAIGIHAYTTTFSAQNYSASPITRTLTISSSATIKITYPAPQARFTNATNDTVNITVTSLTGVQTCNISINWVQNWTNIPFNNNMTTFAFNWTDCSDTFYAYCKDSLNQITIATNTTNMYVKNITLITEDNGNLFGNFSQLSILRAIDSFNSTIYNFMSNNDTSILIITSSKSESIRLEKKYTDLLFIDLYVNLMPSYTPVCVANSQQFYQNIIYSQSNQPLSLKNTLSNCYVLLGRTIYTYQSTLMAEAYTISSNYALYSMDDSTCPASFTFLSMMSGNSAGTYNLDQLEYAQSRPGYSLMGDQVGYQQITNDTLLIYYYNQKGDNTQVDVVFTNSTDTLYYWNETKNPNNFTLAWNHSAFHDSTVLMTLYKHKVDGTITTHSQAVPLVVSLVRGIVLDATFVIIIVVVLDMFGLTFTASKYTFGWFGLIVVGIGLAMTALAPVTLALRLIQAVQIIILVFIALIYKEEYSAVT